MKTITRTLLVAFSLALGAALVPVSLSPTGQLEVAGICASGLCMDDEFGYCNGQPGRRRMAD